jgi:hypothetical protein
VCPVISLAAVAYNVLVVTRAALVSGLGAELEGPETLSSYHMASQVAAVEEGMLIAVPASVWQQFVEMTAAQCAGWLYDIARQIEWRAYRKTPRGPKTPVVRKRTRRGAHIFYD